MANNQSALCERSRIIFDRLQAGELITPDDTHTLIGLCANYNNLCEAQTLASQRADNAQTLLAQERERSQRLQQEVYDYRARVINTEAAYHALLSGAA